MSTERFDVVVVGSGAGGGIVAGELAERGYAHRLARRPGQKEDRFEHLLGGTGDEDADTEPALVQRPASLPPGAGLERRVAELEAQVHRLAGELAQVREELGLVVVEEE